MPRKTVKEVAKTQRAISSRRRPKASYKRELQISKEGLTPLDYLLRVMRNPRNEVDVRVDAAKAAAPYVHPKLAQINTNGTNIVTIIVEGGLPAMPGSPTIMPQLGRGITINQDGSEVDE